MNNLKNRIVLGVIVITLVVTAFLVGNHTARTDNIVNDNIDILYHENDVTGSYEVYIDFKNDSVSEVNQSVDGTQFLLAPNIK